MAERDIPLLDIEDSTAFDLPIVVENQTRVSANVVLHLLEKLQNLTNFLKAIHAESKIATERMHQAAPDLHSCVLSISQLPLPCSLGHTLFLDISDAHTLP
jgi:hypothetical protein